jgi:hypothetical protein
MTTCVPPGRRRIGRQATAAGTILLLLAGLAAPSAALGATLLVTPATGAPGQVLTASGTAFPINEPIVLRWDGAPLPECPASGGCAVNADGTFAVSFAIPRNASLGPHTLRACSGARCDPSDDEYVAVVSTSPTPTPVATPASTLPPPSPTRDPTPRPTGTPAPGASTGSTASASPGPSSSVADPTSSPALPAGEATAAPEPSSGETGTDAPDATSFIPWPAVGVAIVFLIAVALAGRARFLKGSKIRQS